MAFLYLNIILCLSTGIILCLVVILCLTIMLGLVLCRAWLAAPF
jgi:hypothetical protein